ncbi:hypothetical protein N7537_006610 [Penicillium hordei]|uniref:Uncharacterized protein n=1 Tax=Penicillium hordei TaxID=40994 RepID=A0AAD6H5D0_9EURO|nr:uncharacterized protein N7537_006610 [Penicillium hordei]KAJ5603654.1 hypothetical protein N7537_006610 [Penicillium hordei]
MAEFIDILQQRVNKLAEKVAQYTKNKQIMEETHAIATLVRTESRKRKKLPSKAVTELEPSKIPDLFFLKEGDPTDDELRPKDHEMVPLPGHLEIVLDDYALATGGSPANEAMLRSRIDAIMLCTLAMMKRECVYNPRLSTGSIQSTDSIRSLHLQFERSIKTPWKVEGTEYLLSGVVDYSLWFGTPQNYETNLVMVEAKRVGALDSGMFQCLAFMAIIHHARKKANMKNTSVYGIVTDSFRWDFIQIRGNSEYITRRYRWKYRKVQIVSLLYKIFETTAHSSSIQPQPQRKRWREGSDTEFTAELEQPRRG